MLSELVSGAYKSLLFYSICSYKWECGFLFYYYDKIL